MARCGEAGLGEVWSGKAGRGVVRLGKVGQGKAGLSEPLTKGFGR